jgi:hypothetical protein
VSAGGIRSAFPEVTELVREAPALPRWHIIAFRQRQDVPTIKCGDKALEREAVFFDYASAGDKIDITVFVPGLGNGSADDMIGLKTIGYLLLDAAIGEYDVETKLAGIEFVDASAFPERRRRPLQELPTRCRRASSNGCPRTLLCARPPEFQTIAVDRNRGFTQTLPSRQ